jgi:hypothetical protein
MAKAPRGQPAATTPGTTEPRFPGYDVTGQSETWDEATRVVVLGRLGPRPPLRFFTADREPTARALVDRLLAQDDEPRVPVIEMIDQRLLEHRGDGYRYEDMPDDWVAWARSIEMLDVDAHASFGCSFSELGVRDQMRLVEKIRCLDGDWYGLPANHLFELWMRYACDAYYSHPWAWNEIGFGGPAYPRGYKNLGLGKREPWEVQERDASDPVPWADRVEQARAQHVDAPDTGRPRHPDPVDRGAKPSPETSGHGNGSVTTGIDAPASHP